MGLYQKGITVFGSCCKGKTMDFEGNAVRDRVISKREGERKSNYGLSFIERKRRLAESFLLYRAVGQR